MQSPPPSPGPSLCLAPTIASPSAPSPGRIGLQPGQVLSDRFVLKRFIAAGGMGEVWEAEDVVLRETVALKLLSDQSSPESRARIRAELSLARRITHRNVCRVHEFGTHRTNGNPPLCYFTMELLQGVTLSELIRARGPLPENEVLEIVTQLAAGLDAAHRAGVVHRDFKCSNVFLEPGVTPRVVITDFGIARALADDARLSQAGGLLGTPAYMSPEQAEGHEAQPASDLYALGIVAFELLTGRLPFEGSSPMAQVAARLSGRPLDVATLRPDLSEAWRQALAGLLARHPEHRLPSGEAFVTVLRDGSSPERPGARIRVRGAAWGVVVGLLTLAGFWWAAGGSRVRWRDIPTASASTRERARALQDVMEAYSTIQGSAGALRKLVADDPEFSEAHLQLLYVEHFANSNRPRDADELLAAVLRRRARLTSRDQDLLGAIEPALLDPPQPAVALARLEALVQRRPRDAQLWNAIGMLHRSARRFDEASRAFREERAVDPGSLSGIALEASTAYQAGQVAEANRLISQCLARHPAHVACLAAAGDLASAEGRCDELDSIGRSLTAATTAFRARALLYFRFSSLLRAKSTEAERAALLASIRAQAPPVWKGEVEWAAHLASGDLEAQLATLHEESPANDVAPTIDAAAEVRLLLELGRRDEALETATRALALTAALPTPAQLHLDARPRLWMVQRQLGRLSRADHDRQRDAWVASWRQRLGRSTEAQEALVWVIGWAPFVEPNAELGAEAMAFWGQRPLPRHSLALASAAHGLPFLTDLGALAMSGATLADAETVLTQASSQCAFRLQEPRAGLLLAEVQARRGRRQAACTTLRDTLQRWAGLRPHSSSLEHARNLADGLSCER